MRRRWRVKVVLTVACAGLVAGIPAPPAAADATAYLLNVTLRPGYNFASAADALTYGRGVCTKVVQGRRYGDVITDIKTDFATADDYQASYLITQAVNELCPEEIWQLRNSAAHYRPPPG
jgi:Protein of unknown function (DUF732)